MERECLRLDHLKPTLLNTHCRYFYKNRMLRFQCQMMFLDSLRVSAVMVQWHNTYAFRCPFKSTFRMS